MGILENKFIISSRKIKDIIWGKMLKKITRMLKHLKQQIIHSLLRDFEVNVSNPSEIRDLLNFWLVLWCTFLTIVFLIEFVELLKTLKSQSFQDSEYSRAEIKRKMKNLKETETLSNVTRGGAILSYSEPLLDPAFMFIHMLRITKLLELKGRKKVFKKIVNNPNPHGKVIKRRPKVRPLLFYLIAAIKSRIIIEYVDIVKEPIFPICSIAPIERLYCFDFEKTNTLKNENAIEIQAGNSRFIFQTNNQTNKKLMTLGEFEFRRGIDKDGNVPISKRRNLSKISHLKRNRIGKLRKENQSSVTISFDEANPAERNQNIPVSNKPLELN